MEEDNIYKHETTTSKSTQQQKRIYICAKASNKKETKSWQVSVNSIFNSHPA
jgi:hypothetical protein